VPDHPFDLAQRPFRSDAEALALCRAFAAATLPKRAWTHRAHLTIALWHLSQAPAEDALGAIRAGIKRLNRALGTTDTETSGYHETITVLYVRLVAAWRSAAPTEGFADSANRLYDELGGRDVPFRYYSKPVLESVAARLGWVAPDLSPLPDW
jgi:hypothetical protein